MKKFVKENLTIILSILYILSPIDFIPEVILGPLGLIDDLAVAVFLIVLAILRVVRKD